MSSRARCWVRTLAAAASLVCAGIATASPSPKGREGGWLDELDVQAGSADADIRLRELDLHDGVRVTLSPYYLRADRIHLSLGPLGVRVTGSGLLTFCPCDDPPVALGFSGGWAGPPDDLIVENPTLRILGVPVFWLPYLWLRTPRKIGFTTPEASFRGRDGLFLGQGLHVPLDSKGASGLEASLGAYTAGGFATTLDLASEQTATLVRFDVRGGSEVRKDVPSGVGLALDSRGDLLSKTARPELRWDVDAIRGARGLRTTLELDALARPFDRAEVEGSVGPSAIGLEIVDPRGADLDAIAYAHPWVGASTTAPLATLGGLAVAGATGPRWILGRRAESIADVGASAVLAGPLSVATWRIGGRIDGRMAGGNGRTFALVSEAEAELSLPLAREIPLERAAGGPTVVHIIEPLSRVRVLSAQSQGKRIGLLGFVAAPAFASSGYGSIDNKFNDNASLDNTSTSAGLFSMGARTSLGALGGGLAPGTDPFRGKLFGEGMLGILLLPGRRDASAAGSLATTHRGQGGRLLSVALEGAAARAIDGRSRTVSWVALARGRWEASADGLGLELRAALRSELPVLAGFALLGADLAPRLTTATGLDSPGATVGAGAGIPVFWGVRLAGGIDAFGTNARELVRSRLLETQGSLRYSHPCGCFRVSVRGGHVIGRDGVDIFASFELARDAAPRGRDF